MEKKLVNQDITISVVMAAYNASQTVGITLQNILSQTYRNLEIIVVDDGSSDNTAHVVKSFQEKYTNIKLVTLDKNSGPFKARVVGADNATGKYLHFIDADDYLSVDFYRASLRKAMLTQADIVIGNIVLDFKNLGQIRDYPLINDLPFNALSGPNVFKAFMDQGGLNFVYHMNSTKLYTMDLWQKARPYYDLVKSHLIMADDVAMNVPLWYFAKKVERSLTSTLFYVKDDNDSATSNYKISYKKMSKNIADLQTTFEFFEQFLKRNNSYSTYEVQLSNWKRSFVRVYTPNIKNQSFSPKERSDLLKSLRSIAPFKESETYLDTPFFHINTPWRDDLNAIKRDIFAPTTSTVLFSFDSLILSTPGLDASPIYSTRQTGLELLDLAIESGKNVKVDVTSPDQRSALSENLKREYPSINEAASGDFGPDTTRVSLPKPLDIFLERGLEQPLHYKYQPKKPGVMLTVTSILANYFFDNPYIDFIETTAFSGRPSYLGFYSLGLENAIRASKQQRDSKNNYLLNLIKDGPVDNNDPYEAYFISGARLGISQFIEQAASIYADMAILGKAEKNADASLNLVFYTQVWADRQLLVPLLYKHPSLMYSYGPANQASLSGESHLHEALHGKSKVTKMIVYILVNRLLLLAAAKKRLRKLSRR